MNTKPLSITQATRQARRHVDALMPGAMATVESKGTADPVTLEPLMRTVVTFPYDHPNLRALWTALSALPGVRPGQASSYVTNSRITITRTV